MRVKKHILIIDLVLVVGSLLIVGGLVGYARPLVIAPIDDLSTTNTSILFEFEKANLILIDDNPEFSSPQEVHVEDNLVINLKPGVYYWKVVGALESEIREFTIESEIDLKLKKSDREGVVEVVNSGNTRLKVDVYELGTLTGNIVLGVDESEDSAGTKFIGGQEDE